MFGKKGRDKNKGKPSREQLIAQAQANMKKARAELGDETIQKIAAAMQKKNQSPTERAKEKIKSMDKGRVIDHIRHMIDEE